MSRRVAVVGAGLAGVCTAYELARQGCAVTIFERSGSVAEQASFAGSACLLPALPELSPRLEGSLGWRLQRWRAGRKAPSAPPLIELAQLSLSRLTTWRRELSLDDEAGPGVLVLLQDKAHIKRVEAQLTLWREAGLCADLLDAAQARRMEPGLNPETPFSQALALAPSSTGNARLLAQGLRAQAQRLGVEFRFHTTVRGLDPGRPTTLRHEYTPPEPAPRVSKEAHDTVPTPLGIESSPFDAVALCCGLEAAPLLRPLGRRLPLGALHEASVTVPLRVLEAHPELGPQAAVLDLTREISVARMGQRIRVSGARRLGQATGAAPRVDFERLHHGLQAWYPGAALHQQVQHWQGRRAITPDGLPLLGASGVPGVWLNLSPNLHGWGLVPGSAEVLAQQITDGAPALDLAALDARRLD